MSSTTGSGPGKPRTITAGSTTGSAPSAKTSQSSSRSWPVAGGGIRSGLVLNPRVDRSSMVTVRMVKYSVPARFIGRRSGSPCGPPSSWCSTAVPWSPGIKRIVAKGGQSVQLDHYLEVLKTKPGALPGSTALARARESGAFTSAHEAFWAAARRVNGDAAAPGAHRRPAAPPLDGRRGHLCGDHRGAGSGGGQRRRRRGRSPQTRNHLRRGWGRFGPSSRCSC